MPYTMNQLKKPGVGIHATKVYAAIMSRAHEHAHSDPFDAIFIAYLFYKLLNSGDNKLESPYSLEETAKMQWERFKSGEIALDRWVLNTAITSRIKREFIDAYDVYESVGDIDDIYAALVAFFDNFLHLGKVSEESKKYSTSDSLVRLTQSILDIKKNDRVADICCGNGNFLFKSFELEPRAEYSGYELDIRCAAILAMKADILGAKPLIEQGDIFFTLSDKNIKFDKIFSNYPLGSWLEGHDKIASALPFKIGRNSSDWYFNNAVIDHLAEGGRAITIAGGGSTWNEAGKDARKYFIEKGYIEAVISLSSKLIPETTIPITVYVFSHNNKSVRLVDAEDIVTAQNRYDNTLSDENIEKILSLLQNDSDKSVVVTAEEAKEKDYSLAFGAYSSSLPEYENGASIASVADIIRGTLSPRNNTTTKNTGRYLLQISDLENGTIKKTLENDRFIETEELRPEQKLLPYDLIISRIGQLPIKAAVVAPGEERELYPNGNMYVLRMKGSSVNPYYLLAFLLSKEGQEALNRISTGSVTKIISAKMLSQLIFPLKDAREQRKVANSISKSIAQYEDYVHKAELAKSGIENAYYDGGR